MPRKTMKPRNMSGKGRGVRMSGKGMPKPTKSKGPAASMPSKSR